MPKHWLRLAEGGRACARLYAGTQTFHPKVLVVSDNRNRFAIVGSANLSAGGLRDNIECSVFVTEKVLIDQFVAWFDGMFQDSAATRQLTGDDITEYEPKFKRARKHLAAARAAQRDVQAGLAKRHNEELIKWAQAISKAREYFGSSQFTEWYPTEKKRAARQIKTHLRFNDFHFSRDDWDNFYKIWDLGHIREAWKNAAWKQQARMQEGFAV